MKREIIHSIILTVLCIVFFAGFYPMIIWAIAQFAPGKGEGITITANGHKYYTNIGQKFTGDQYFWSRPSAVDYNAAGSGGSNKGPNDSAYLRLVQARIDTFQAHNPAIPKNSIPSDLVTASGSGLDPDISIKAALVQIPRIAKVRGIKEALLLDLINKQQQQPLASIAGPSKINVLELNLRLDEISKQH